MKRLQQKEIIQENVLLAWGMFASLWPEKGAEVGTTYTTQTESVGGGSPQKEIQSALSRRGNECYQTTMRNIHYTAS